jgi:hypothetical protein
MGFLWNIGFRPGNSPADPAGRAEYGLITPFYLNAENGNRMLLYNANYLNDGFRGPARYDLPITLYGHTWRNALYDHQALEDYIFRIRGAQESLLYNFVTERQLSKSIAAALATEVRVYFRPVDVISDFLRQVSGRAPRLDRFLVVVHNDVSAPLFDEVYAGSIGVRVDLGGLARPFPDTDSAVRFSKGNALFLSLAGGGSRGTRIWSRHENVAPALNVMAVNLPAGVVSSNGEVTVEFFEDGLQQVFLYSDSPIVLRGDGFEVRTVDVNTYRVSKTGPKSTVIIGTVQ